MHCLRLKGRIILTVEDLSYHDIAFEIIFIGRFNNGPLPVGNTCFSAICIDKSSKLNFIVCNAL